MIGKTHTTKSGYTYQTYHPDKLSEYFVRAVPIGSCYKWYIPVKRLPQEMASESWVWYLIPFVLPIKIAMQIIFSVYITLRTTLSELIDYQKDFEKVTATQNELEAYIKGAYTTCRDIHAIFNPEGSVPIGKIWTDDEIKKEIKQYYDKYIKNL